MAFGEMLLLFSFFMWDFKNSKSELILDESRQI